MIFGTGQLLFAWECRKKSFEFNQLSFESDVKWQVNVHF
jgi:hypothetical protein